MCCWWGVVDGADALEMSRRPVMRGFVQIVKRQFNRVCDGLLVVWWPEWNELFAPPPGRGFYEKMEGGEGREPIFRQGGIC